jgi:hypothetical protein
MENYQTIPSQSILITKGNMELPQAPNSWDEFGQKARDFVKRAKEAGKSNVAIKNTIELMYGMFQKQMADYTTELKDVDSDGNLELVNTKTGEIVQRYGESPESLSVLSEGESSFNPNQMSSNPVTSSETINTPGADPLKSTAEYDAEIDKMDQRRSAGVVGGTQPDVSMMPKKPDLTAVAEDVKPNLQAGQQVPNLGGIYNPVDTELYLPNKSNFIGKM